MRKHIVLFPDGSWILLDSKLIEKQKLSEETLNLITHAHIYRWTLYREMEDTVDDPAGLQLLAKKVEDLAFYMQELWGFEKNTNYHKWWEMPGCNCASLDNEANYGTNYRCYSTECPIHSWKQFEKPE